MKNLWISILSFVLVSEVFASDKNIEVSRSLGKPGVNAFFMDTNTIEILPNVEKEIVITIQVSGEEIGYTLQSTDGLVVRDLNQSSISKNGSQYARMLSIPVIVVASGVGRYYLHIVLSVVENGIEKKTAISKIISSQSERLSDVSLKKSKSQSIHILPATETVIQK